MALLWAPHSNGVNTFHPELVHTRRTLANNVSNDSSLDFGSSDIDCVYFAGNASEFRRWREAIYVDGEDHLLKQMVRCPLLPRGFTVSIRVRSNAHLQGGNSHRWNSLVYEALVGRDNTTVVFVKGLNLRPERVSNASRCKCVYGLGFSEGRVFAKIRCHSERRRNLAFSSPPIAPIRIHNTSPEAPRDVRMHSGAQFLKEWIIYHGISMYAAAGFAHCALRARDSCKWVGFIDVDEFFYLPNGLSLLDVLRNQAKNVTVGEIRVSCHNFGPSGLSRMPPQGVTVGYTRRKAVAERHKSIVNPEALNSTLINMVHHFHLRDGFQCMNLERSEMVINHYKYQVREVFKEKFRMRVATDWQEEQNVGSEGQNARAGD
ncbi:Glycosyltransferase family 92 protein, partial [Cucurbita argyrosperma subsp. argyrosperma]